MSSRVIAGHWGVLYRTERRSPEGIAYEGFAFWMRRSLTRWLMRAVMPGCSASMTREAEQTTAKVLPEMRSYSASMTVEPVRWWDSAIPPTRAGTMHPGSVRVVSAAARAASLIGLGLIMRWYPVSGFRYQVQVAILYIHAAAARAIMVMTTLGLSVVWTTDPIREPVTA